MSGPTSTRARPGSRCIPPCKAHYQGSPLNTTVMDADYWIPTPA